MRPLPASVQARLGAGGRGLTILVLRLGALGDILRTLPAVRLLRSALPEARIGWVVDARWAAVLEGHPDLDRVVAFPRSLFEGLRAPWDWPRLARSIAAWSRELRVLGAGLALDFHGNLRSGIVGWLSRAPVRLGYSGHQQKEGNRLLTTHRIGAGPRRISRVARNLDLVRILGVRCDRIPDGGLPPDGAAEKEAAGIVIRSTGGREPYAVLSPGASPRQAYKRPPAALLAAAARALADRGARPLIVWGPGEEADARRVADLIGAPACLAPPTDLRVLTALLRGARLFVGGDTGPLHLACAVGCPVVALYGPTDPVVNAPWGVTHRAVKPPSAPYSGVKRRDRRIGFGGIAPGDVEAAVSAVLAEPRR